MLENLVKKSRATLTGIVHRVVDQVSAMHNEPVDGTTKYDMVINRVDENGDTSTSKRTYKTALSRQIAAQQLVEQSKTVDTHVDGDDDDDETDFDDQPGITSLVFEDRLLFWQKSAQTPTIPNRIPRLVGKGRLVLRCNTSRGIIEVAGMSNSAALTALESLSGSLDTSPSTAAVIRRHVAFRRKLVLCAAD
ncbi:MAG: hypothetical protein P4L53_23840 [Candidatus Obscuribacterales bacterium]|nr:hypothetical protein [Candidatus Obscuribacterales bacterium]